MNQQPGKSQDNIINEILEGSCRNPHDYLGMHQESGGVAVRVYDPAAKAVTVIVGKNRYPMVKVDDGGIFSCLFGRKKDLFA